MTVAVCAVGGWTVFYRIGSRHEERRSADGRVQHRPIAALRGDYTVRMMMPGQWRDGPAPDTALLGRS